MRAIAIIMGLLITAKAIDFDKDALKNAYSMGLNLNPEYVLEYLF